MPKLDIDTSRIKDAATVDAFERILTHADQNPFISLDGKIVTSSVRTIRSSDPVILYHNLGYVPNVAFSMGIVGEDFAGTSFTPVYDNKDTNTKTIKVMVSDPCEAVLVMYVGRTMERRAL